MRAAASLVLARDGAAGLEVLLVKRNEGGDFPGLHVFPGGLVDAADATPELLAASRRSAADAAALLAADVQSALPAFIAALREALEEAGVLPGGGSLPPERVHEWQRRLLARELSFAQLVTTESLSLATDMLGYLSHWITPAGVPRRYDTRFFVTRMPDGQQVRVDGREAVRADWYAPRAALDAFARGDIRLIFPTVRNLEALAAYATTDDLLQRTRSPRPVPAILPKLVNRGIDGMRLLLPGDAGYDEA